MVQVDKLKKGYGERTLFEDVSFHVGRKERCVIVGRNGSGKSTLLKIIAGMEESDGGEIFFPKGTRIGTLPQHLHFTEGTVLEEALLGLPKEERDQEWRAEIILSGLGFSESDFYETPESFSGGYQLRLALCKVLVGEPDLLLLDEPTNYLDILSIRWLERFLRSWHGQILFISHDRSFVDSICTHVIGIKRGKVKKVTGQLNTYYEAIATEEETHEKRREKLDKKKKHMMSFVERFGAKATKATQAQSRLKAIEKMDALEALQEEESLDFHFCYKPFRNRLALRTEKVSFSFEEDKPLISNISLELGNGERLAIIGKNGSGKSTILRLLIGELEAQKGSVELATNVTCAYFGQTNIDRLNPNHTIEEELMAASPNTPYPAIRNACGVMLFSGDDAKKRISVLSGGERSRVLLAKILLTPANLLLLDEPTQHLDVDSIAALMEAILAFEGSVILVSHDEEALKLFDPHKLIICHEKRQEFFLGNYPLFLEKSGWIEER